MVEFIIFLIVVILIALVAIILHLLKLHNVIFYFSKKSSIQRNSKSLEDYRNDLKIIVENYEKCLKEYDENLAKKKYNLNDTVDPHYCSNILSERTKHYNWGDKYAWIDLHINEYKIKIQDWDYTEQVSFLKLRVIGYAFVFKQLKKTIKEIQKLAKEFGFDINEEVEKTTKDEIILYATGSYNHIILWYDHAFAAVYSAAKYLILLRVPLNQIEDWFPEFESRFIYDDSAEERAEDLLKKLFELSNEDNPEKLNELVKDYENQYPNDIGLFNQCAYQLFEKKQFVKGIKLLEKYINKDNDEHLPYFDTCAVGYYHLEEYDKALKISNISLNRFDSDIDGNSFFPDDLPERLTNRAKIKLKMGETKSAVKDLKDAIEKDNEYEDAISLLKEIKSKS